MGRRWILACVGLGLTLGGCAEMPMPGRALHRQSAAPERSAANEERATSPSHRQYYDQRRQRYYFYDPSRRAYFWEDGSPKS